jgi:hypothetical protein
MRSRAHRADVSNCWTAHPKRDSPVAKPVFRSRQCKARAIDDEASARSQVWSDVDTRGWR